MEIRNLTRTFERRIISTLYSIQSIGPFCPRGISISHVSIVCTTTNIIGAKQGRTLIGPRGYLDRQQPLLKLP